VGTAIDIDTGAANITFADDIVDDAP
jgi:hypothetical protein